MKFTCYLDIKCCSVQHMKFLVVILEILIITTIQFCWAGPPTIFFFTFSILSLIITVILLLVDAFQWRRYVSDVDTFEPGFFLCGGLVNIVCGILMGTLKGSRWEEAQDPNDPPMIKNSLTAFVAGIGTLNGILCLIIAARTHQCSGTGSRNDCEDLTSNNRIGDTGEISSPRVDPPPPYTDAVQIPPYSQFM
ncbi:hypothetical protein Fcan01_20865 [Folsomia candida]|uniref:Uncharacterized protein n=1 Tax=Folsomia candida TaxID=158441 RepID=A0A226DI24_FOLCA|nr:hypothetical protein Fcan01_20865 [Folsomia candida]